MTHLMIDVETMGISHVAPVMSIGAVFFNPYVDEIGSPFYGKIKHTGIISVDPSTLEWWMKQDEKTRLELFIDTHSIESILTYFRSFYERETIYRVWSHGCNFDIPIIENLLSVYKHKIPWSFRDIRDTRTIYELANVKPEFDVGMKHNALDDAIAQAKAVCRAYAKLEIKE